MSPHDFLVDGCEQGVCRRIDTGTLCGRKRGRGSESDNRKGNTGEDSRRHQPPARSSWISQRPSLLTMCSVLLPLIFRLSERYACRKVTTALSPLSVTLGDSTATSIFLGVEMRCFRAASHWARVPPFGVLKSLA